MSDLKVTLHKGALAFYIDGSLQFDTRDEAVYHESLALPAAALAEARFRRPLSALVLGGGDGLALRELLKFGSVSSVDLVDYDRQVIELGRGAFSRYNNGALCARRVTVRCKDAGNFLQSAARKYDIVLADFTFPCDLPGCSLFTQEFFGKIGRALSRRGIFALNAVSPEKFPPAYWAIYKTLRAAGFYPRPLSASIPSFSAHGYGKWGFFFASRRAVTQRELGNLRLPPAAAFLTPEKLHENMRFNRSTALFGAGAATAIRSPSDLLALLNVPEPAPQGSGGGETLDFFLRSNRALPRCGFPCNPSVWSAETLAEWEDRLAALFGAFDWDRLIDEAGRISGAAAARLRDELDEFREELPSLFSGDGSRAQRAYRVLAAFSILLIMINLAYPDNAFAKGYHHSSHGGSGYSADFALVSSKAPSPFHGSAFQFTATYRGGCARQQRKAACQAGFYRRRHGAAAAGFRNPGKNRRAVLRRRRQYAADPFRERPAAAFAAALRF